MKSCYREWLNENSQPFHNYLQLFREEFYLKIAKYISLLKIKKKKKLKRSANLILKNNNLIIN